MKMLEQDILEFQKMIDAAIHGNIQIFITSGESWDNKYCGDVSFRSSDGWKFVAFNDCDSFDYLDSITTPRGTNYNFDDIWESAIFINWDVGEDMECIFREAKIDAPGRFS